MFMDKVVFERFIHIRFSSVSWHSHSLTLSQKLKHNVILVSTIMNFSGCLITMGWSFLNILMQQCYILSLIWEKKNGQILLNIGWMLWLNSREWLNNRMTWSPCTSSPTLNSASKQNRQGLCSISRDPLALSRKHTSRSSFFRVKRDSASSWPNQDRTQTW